jgi:hypothetical protein
LVLLGCCTVWTVVVVTGPAESDDVGPATGDDDGADDGVDEGAPAGDEVAAGCSAPDAVAGAAMAVPSTATRSMTMPKNRTIGWAKRRPNAPMALGAAMYPALPPFSSAVLCGN